MPLYSGPVEQLDLDALTDEVARMLPHLPYTGDVDLSNPEYAAGRCGLVSGNLAQALRESALAPLAHVLHCEGLPDRNGWDNWADSWLHSAIPQMDSHGRAERIVSHAVVALGDGRVVDATARQFDRNRRLPAVLVQDEGSLEDQWQRVWHVDPTYTQRRYDDRGGYYTSKDYQELLLLLAS